MHFEVAGSDGRPVRAVAHGPEGAPAVLVLHGFKGFKDWGMFPWMAERIGQAGYRAVRFDFSHNGVEAKDFDRLDLFLLDTWTRHQEDLAAVTSMFGGPMAVVGHSRGGADAVLFAAHEPRVRCVATLAAVSDTMVPADAETVLHETGYYPIPNARTGQTMPMARTFFDDARRHSVEDATRDLQAPLLVVHGDADESVPPAHATRLQTWKPDAELHLVEGAGHTFGAVHPWKGETPHLVEALDEIVAFLKRNLG